MGTSSKSTTAAQQAEQWKQSQIDKTIDQINAIYDSDSRKQQISDYQTALQDYYLQDLNYQKTTADRDLKFALARSGLTGGSRQVDANRTLGEEYQKGILQAEQSAQSAASNLQSQDEQSRSNLLSLAQSGLSTTDAATRAASAMQSSLSSAKADAYGQGLGDIFTSVATTKKNSEEQKQQRLANAQYTSLYGPYYTSFNGFSGGY